MLKLGFRVDIQKPLVRLNQWIDKASDLTPLYRKWGRLLRADAQTRIREAKEFPPLAESTQKRLSHTRTTAITAQGNVRARYAKRLEVQLQKQIRAEKLDEEVLDDLHTLMRGGKEALQLSLSDRRSHALVRLQKQFRRAAQGTRTGGSKREKDRHHLLGKIGSSLTSVSTREEAITESRIPWSRIHNEGGTAGHGAQIPARPFFVMTPALKRLLSECVVEYFMERDP